MPEGRWSMAAVEVVGATQRIGSPRDRTLRQPPWAVNERARPLRQVRAPTRAVTACERPSTLRWYIGKTFRIVFTVR